MKTFILCILLFMNSSIIIRKTDDGLITVTSKTSTLKVDSVHSQVGWHAEKPTGTHTGNVKIFLGRLNFQGGKLSGGFILVNMQSLKVTDLVSPDKEQLEANLKGDNFFDTGRYTVARFDITNVEYVDPANLRKVIISGTLNMHGIIKKISFKTGIQKNSGTEFIAIADAAINRRDWNIATGNFKYNNFISPTITLHIMLKAASAI